MFAASASSLQAEPVYPKHFADLGCTINSKSQIVQVSNEHEFITYHISSNERESGIRMEAVHFCVRKAMAQAAAGMDVRQVYLTGGDGDVVMSTKPRGPHLRIFTSDLEHLKGKKNVLIVIGEHDQDPGIWKWRHVMTQGGIDGGTMVGLMKSLTKMITEGAGLEEAVSSEQTSAAGEGAQADTNDPASDGERFGALPGVIILNPGQRLYSHELNECMTEATWQARPRPSGINSNYKAHPVFNAIPEHETAKKHLQTMFDEIIPQLVSEDARYYIIGIKDGAENFINYMDAKLQAKIDHELSTKVAAMAFIQPTHDPLRVKSWPFQIYMQQNGKSWVASGKPKDMFISKSTAMDRMQSDRLSVRSPSPEACEEAESIAIEQMQDWDMDSVAADEEADLPVSCSTYSGGTWDDSMILPEMMESVLEFLWEEGISR